MERNSQMITPLGTVKRTYCVPQTMWSGVRALEEKSPCLLVDFRGLNDFNARQIVATLQDKWPDLRATRISFPDTDHVSELFTGEIMAQALELSKNREKLIQAVCPHVKEAQAVGMPAIFGMYRTQEIIAELEEKIGAPVFEIPTMPVSVPGLRLNDAFIRQLSLKGVKHFSESRVLEVSRGYNGGFVLGIGNKTTEYTVRTKGVILASGRFWGRGLYADRKRIREAIFDLPVYQPMDRKGWHREDFLDSRGHPANRAGLEIDDSFRPLDSSGRPAFETLFAAGSILAHQDWMRMKCGSGLAIATAYAAVNAFLKLNG
jgi:glycerol-3-phosphate dehydrogenase subunit B